MARTSCDCGCGTLTHMTAAQEACGCNCGCCVPAEKPAEEEAAELRRLRDEINQRLAELSRNY